mmetsp:Transcript_16154/g.39811  ORF Transcript_16154/g.39811 Transcript_16154/m.39811 type:complete len:343 (-) Transcript_16154:826-1854(-)
MLSDVAVGILRFLFPDAIYMPFGVRFGGSNAAGQVSADVPEGEIQQGPHHIPYAVSYSPCGEGRYHRVPALQSHCSLDSIFDRPSSIPLVSVNKLQDHFRVRTRIWLRKPGEAFEDRWGPLGKGGLQGEDPNDCLLVLGNVAVRRSVQHCLLPLAQVWPFIFRIEDVELRPSKIPRQRDYPLYHGSEHNVAQRENVPEEVWPIVILFQQGFALVHRDLKRLFIQLYCLLYRTREQYALNIPEEAIPSRSSLEVARGFEELACDQSVAHDDVNSRGMELCSRAWHQRRERRGVRRPLALLGLRRCEWGPFQDIEKDDEGVGGDALFITVAIPSITMDLERGYE